MKKMLLLSLLAVFSSMFSQTVEYKFYGDLQEYPDSSGPIMYLLNGMPMKKVVNFYKTDSTIL